MARTVVEYDLRAWLEAIAAITTAGAGVYPFAGVPQNVTWPFVTYHRVTGSRWRTCRGPTGVSRPLIQLDVWGKTDESARLLAAEIREALDDASGTTVAGRLWQAVLADEDTSYVDDGDDPAGPPHGDEVSQFRVSIPVRIIFNEV